MKLELTLTVDFHDAPGNARSVSPTVRAALSAASAAIERMGYPVSVVGASLAVSEQPQNPTGYDAGAFRYDPESRQWAILPITEEQRAEMQADQILQPPRL